MRARSILYHDVVSPGVFNSSGFPGAAAARYKLEQSEFEKHLEAIATAIPDKPGNVLDLLAGPGVQRPFLLTFDDGGASASSCIVGILEQLGWQAHFFVTTNYIGCQGFLSKQQIRALRNHGHIIGSHSCSHPERMAKLGWEQLVWEWDTSRKLLSDILGEEVCVASVPAGDYSPRVAEAASFAGIRVLFNSEPTTRCRFVEGCLVLGRYAIWRGMSPAIAAGLASERLMPRIRQLLSWKLKKVAKSAAGPAYTKMRNLYLGKE